MTGYLLRHVQVLLSSVGQLVRNPVATLMTVGVIGITLALPGGLYVLVENVERLTAGWDRHAQVSVFLTKSATAKNLQDISATLRKRPDIASATPITAAEALMEFQAHAGFGTALDALAENPLPHTIAVVPGPGIGSAEGLRQLVAELQALPEVDDAQLDVEWVQRLHLLLRLARRGVWLLAGLFSIAVLLIVSNTVRLAVSNRRDEIEIIRLIGGTDPFIRRPFLYAGFLQGVVGGAIAWILIAGSLSLITSLVSELAVLYGGGSGLTGLRAAEALALMAVGGGLGWLASRWAVARHLTEIDPQ
ncbi:MAG: permease-like cell division protein FtsX [Gammaproteobacteria bacterium]|nr:permease-like cell division protein FtsX [Gammaproteobacteria bacterium]